MWTPACTAATCAMTHLPRCWLWRTSTLAVRCWFLRLVLDLCWDPSWKEWEASLFLYVQLSLFFFFTVFCTDLWLWTNTLCFLFIQAMAQWSKCTQEVGRFVREWRILAFLHIFTTCCMSFPSATSMLFWQALWTLLPKTPLLVGTAFFFFF